MNSMHGSRAFIMLGTMLCVAGLTGNALAIATVTYGDHVVTKRKPLAYGKYTVSTEDTVAELITTCGNPDKFEPETDEVVLSRKHDNMWTIPVRNDETKSRAVCPLIPGNESSYVFVRGKFAAEDAGGSKSGTGGDAAAPQWGSILKEPGVHVILVHQYDANNQIIPGFNLAVARSGLLLERQYAGDGNKVLRVKVGVGGEITDISGLPAYLEKEQVKHGSVVTLDTLGHGEHFRKTYTFNDDRYPFLLMFLKSARSSDVDTVGRVQDSEAADKQFKMPTSAFCGKFAAFLKDGAFVGLWHCYTAEGYRSPFPLPTQGPSEPPPGYVRRMNKLLEDPPAMPSIMAQAIQTLGGKVVVAGATGTISFDNNVPQADDHFVFGQPQ